VTLGQAFFPEAGCGGGEGAGVSAAVTDGLSSGVGVGLAFFRFDLLFGVAVGDGVGEAFLCFGDALGDGVGVAFSFRCLRLGVGVGTGAKAFLIFAPNDSSAGTAGRTTNKIATMRSHFIPLSFRAKSRNLGLSL